MSNESSIEAQLDSTDLPWASPAMSRGTEVPDTSPSTRGDQKAIRQETPSMQPLSARVRPTPPPPLPHNQSQNQAPRPMSAQCKVNSHGKAASGAVPNPRNARSTFSWRPNEHSLQRNSFNSMVGKSRLDVTEVMIRDASMGRQAEMGPTWCPGGLASRKMAEALSQRR